MKKKKIFFLFIALFLLGISFASQTRAVCPACTITVCVGVGLSRWLGIDDLITGIWIGALIISLIIWTIVWFNKKNIHFLGRNIVVVLFYYLAVLLPLRFTEIVGHQLNKIWGIDKLVFGIFFGSVVFSVGVFLHYYLKKKNNNKVYFPFQKIVIPVSLLIILSLVFFFITKYCLIK